MARALRAIRRRKRWTQRQLGQQLGVSQSEMSRRERGSLGGCPVEAVERWAAALGAYLALDLRFEGERPLTDARHAALQTWLVELLRSHGWVAEPEVSFNHYGDRGRIDVLAYQPPLRVLLVTEIKTQLDDVQELVGRLDVKRRIAPTLAADRGWSADTVVPAVVFREDRTIRRRLGQHQELFGSFALRARAAAAWLRRPTRRVPQGVLMMVRMPDRRQSAGGSRRGC